MIDYYRSLWNLTTKINKSDLNIFSLAVIASVYLNLTSNSGKKDQSEESKKGLSEREILEYLIKAQREQVELIIKKSKELLKIMEEAYRGIGYETLYIEGELTSRGLFGVSEIFGRPIFEIGLYLDPYLNVPIIPASTIKGSVRSAYELTFSMNQSELDKLFGSKNTQGICIFTDAYPIQPGLKGFILYPDVITPHYKDDLLGEDKVQPNPIVHLSIAPKSVFGFIIAIKDSIDDEIKSKLYRAISIAFNMGIGARVAVGYGIFNIRKFCRGFVK